MRIGTADDDGVIPLGLVYACQEAPETQAVFIPADEDQRLVAVVEPGHDPRVMWRQLRDFLKREGIPYAAPSDPAA